MQLIAHAIDGVLDLPLLIADAALIVRRLLALGDWDRGS